ncbi:CrcB family protein [Castellaniella sp.]|uniref:CrcB family protein n=1 Tax=Castellaniella sp. TaxID=1955812 RepID=UPI002AFEB960|nr:CrcB family protein [Castellaniella sp.]
MKLALLVFIGGGIGAVVRELFMRFSPTGLGGFPLDILLANLLACLLLGLVAAARAQGRIGDQFYLFMATGVTGGLSTFSSFAYGPVVLMSGSSMGLLIAVAYVLISLALGYLAMLAGGRLGKDRG